MRIIQVVFAVAICITSLHGQADSLTLYFEKGLDLKKQGRHNEAISNLEHAVTFSGADSLKAAAHHQLGNLHYRNSHYQEAIHNWEKAITHRTNYLTYNHVDIIKTYINVGTAENILSHKKRSHKALSRALDLLNSQKTEDVFRKANVYAALGGLEKNELNLSLASDYLLEAYRLYTRCERDIQWRKVNTCTDLFDTYKLLQKPKEALVWADKAMKEVQQINASEASLDIYLANAYSNRGIAYKQTDQFEKAEADYLMALALNKRLAGRADYLGIVLNNLIALYSQMENTEQAEEMVHQAKTIFIQQNQPQLLANTLIEEAKFRHNQTDYLAAIDAYEEARQLLSTDMDQQLSELVRTAVNETTIVDLVTGQLKSKVALYRLTKENNILIELDSQIRELTSIIDEISLGMYDLESKLEFSGLVNDFFDVAVEIKYLSYTAEKDVAIAEYAWELMDNAKSRSIFDKLRLDQASLHSKGLSTIYNSRKTLQDHIFQLQTRLTLSQNLKQNLKDSIMDLQSRSTKLDLKIDSLLQEDQVWRIDQDQRQASLQSSQTLHMQYHMATDSSYLICKYRGSIQFYKLGSSKNLKNQLQQFIEVTRQTSSDVSQYSRIAGAAFISLFPIEFRTDIPKSIIVIPDHIISKIPFGAMVVSESLQDISFSQVDYLINHSDVSYASSHSILDYQSKHYSDSEPKTIGYAIDYTDFPVGQYSQLVHSIAELQSLQPSTALKTFSQQAATNSSFFEEAENATLIHLSLHGISDASDPALSYLQFYPKDAEDDGKLFIKDIYHKGIDPELIVLSSCRSGDGYLSEAEGSISFAHAFSYSNAQSVVVNLWDSASNSSFELIQGFYKNLFRGLSKSKSLQLTKIDYFNQVKAQELAHPFYWATLVMYGDPSSIELGPSSANSYLMWIIAFILLISFYFISRMRRAASSA